MLYLQEFSVKHLQTWTWIFSIERKKRKQHFLLIVGTSLTILLLCLVKNYLNLWHTFYFVRFLFIMQNTILDRVKISEKFKWHPAWEVYPRHCLLLGTSFLDPWSKFQAATELYLFLFILPIFVYFWFFAQLGPGSVTLVPIGMGNDWEVFLWSDHVVVCDR